MVVILQLVRKAGHRNRAEAALRKACAVRGSSHQRDQTAFAGDLRFFRSPEERLSQRPVRFHGAVELTEIDHQLTGVVDRV